MHLYDNLRLLLSLFLVAILFISLNSLRKAQGKLTPEQKASLLDTSLQKRNYIGLFFLIGLVLLYLAIEKFFPFILIKIPPLLLFVLLILALVTLGVITNILYFKRIKQLQLPKEYYRKVIFCKVALFASVIIYATAPYFSENVLPNINRSTDLTFNATKHPALITCPSLEQVSAHLTDRLNWQADSGLWSITFIYRDPQEDEKVLALSQALINHNSLECYYYFGKSNTQIGGAQSLIVQSQLSGTQKIEPAGYNWTACRQGEDCKICYATTPVSCPVTIKP